MVIPIILVLDRALRDAGIPIDGVSVGDPNNRATWKVSYAATPCVTLRVRPTVMLGPGDVDIQARVARHADHRTLRVAWDSDVAGAGARQIPLEADTDRVLVQWWNKDQP